MNKGTNKGTKNKGTHLSRNQKRKERRQRQHERRRLISRLITEINERNNKPDATVVHRILANPLLPLNNNNNNSGPSDGDYLQLCDAIAIKVAGNMSTIERRGVARVVLEHPAFSLDMICSHSHHNKFCNAFVPPNEEYGVTLLAGMIRCSNSSLELHNIFDFAHEFLHKGGRILHPIDYDNMLYSREGNVVEAVLHQYFLDKELLAHFCTVFPMVDFSKRCDWRYRCDGNSLEYLLQKQFLFDGFGLNSLRVLGCLEFLLERLSPAAINQPNRFGLTPLHTLLSSGYYIFRDGMAALELLLQAGADVNYNKSAVVERLNRILQNFGTEAFNRIFLLLIMHGLKPATASFLRPGQYGGRVVTPIEAACLLNKFDMLCKLLRASVKKSARPQHLRVRSAFDRELATRGFGQEEMSWQILHILRLLALPWAPKRHHLYSLEFRRAVFTILLVLNQQHTAPALSQLPFELWFLVFDFLAG